MINNFKLLQLPIVLAFSALILSACIRPYQPDIQQGNILNNSNLMELNYGMSKQEVLFILGTPMITDPFNKSRWDYYYSKLDQRKQHTETRLVTAMFEGDKLINLEGDVDLPNIQALEPSIEDQQHGGSIITEPTHKPKGLFNRIKKAIKDKNKITNPES